MSLENGTQYDRLLEGPSSDRAIAIRMLFQLRRNPDVTFRAFVEYMKRISPLTPADVLSELRTLDAFSASTACVIILIDGVQQFVSEENAVLEFATFVRAVSPLVVSVDGPWIIAVLAATTTMPVKQAFGGSGQFRVFLNLRPLDGRIIVRTTSAAMGALYDGDPLIRVLSIVNILALVVCGSV